ncbi:MAG: trypsin-like peptidase domain-containing protein [Flavobacteriaceae bacterium]|jgi:Do/DeqQ family serine protease|nr:trypsin-like peptidase domain-containing protein [Flavobacteriaceae bacterium]
MSSLLRHFLVSTTAAILVVIVYHFFAFTKEIIITQPATPLINTSNTNPIVVRNAAENTDFTIAVEKTIDAVVHITNTSKNKYQHYNLWDLFSGSTKSYPRVGMGSGVIVSPDGYLITNNHVIENAGQIEVTTNDNRIFTAELIGTDPSSDIAVLKIIGDQSFPYVRFADSDQTRIGEWVLAVGNPFNLNSTVTAGIISAKARDLNPYDATSQSFLQTDAAVNSGNSGGALVNNDGDLIGINTAITSNGMGTFIGYSFAVPSNIARKVYEDIIEHGMVKKALLGVSGNGLNDQISKEYNLDTTEGFYIASVEDGMGAKEAGLQDEDIIIGVDDTKVSSFADMTGYLNSKRPGDKVKVTYLRDGKTRTTIVTLKPNPFINYFDMRLKDLTTEEANRFGVSKGVKIASNRNERLRRRGIGQGILIQSINGTEIQSTDDLQKIKENEIYEIEFMNKDQERFRFFFD